MAKACNQEMSFRKTVQLRIQSSFVCSAYSLRVYRNIADFPNLNPKAEIPPGSVSIKKYI